MATEPVRRKWTLDEYLAYEQETGIKHEYIDGEIYAMTGGTDKHSILTVNTSAALFQRLRDNPCRPYSSDMRVQISAAKYVYPDVSVVCGEATFADDNRTMLTNPALVVEVMSPSSADYDRGKKFDFYRSLSSVQHYLLIAQEQMKVLLYTRQDNDTWLLREFTAPDDELPLGALAITVPLSDLYLDVEFNGN